MGSRLGLQIQQSSSYSATFRNELNSVIFFADPGGRVYVNGRQVGARGGMACVNKTLYVPRKLEQEIRLAMVTQKVYVPAPTPPAPPKDPPLSFPPQLKYGPVVIDPGHGGKAPGTVHHGTREKDINLIVALMVVDKLKAEGVDARLTRSTDVDVELNDRAAFSNRIGAKLFVSLHCDAASNRRARGFTIFAPETRMSQTGSFAAEMEKAMGSTPMTSRGVRAAGFRVLLRTKCPALLVEMGFLSNSYDARLLNSSSCQRDIARAVANGITRYLTK